MPPGLTIKIFMEKLKGSIDKKNGDIELNFEARFVFSIFSVYKFPDLIVNTSLKSSEIKSRLHFAKGKPLQQDGNTTIVGIAIIPKTNNKLLDCFLELPNEALAILKCKITSVNLNAQA